MTTAPTRSSHGQFRERLRARAPALERAVLERVYGVSDPNALDDPQYVAGLKEAVSAALEYGLEAVEIDPSVLPPVPSVILAQARSAARNGVSLDTVLRRYFAGYTLLRDFLLRGIENGHVELGAAELQRIWRTEAALFDRLIAAVADAHTEEASGPARGAEHRRAERVRRLLAGELLDLSDLPYELEGWHLGALACGPGGQAVARRLGEELDRRVLWVRAEGETVWVWMGGRRQLSSEDALRAATAACPPAVTLTLGEPGSGIEGWRLTHRQAKAALPVAQKTETKVLRYTDVALLASAIRDEVLAESLEETFLAPLCAERDGGEALRQTLDAYFKAGRNLSSAAGALGLSRPTVRSRLRMVEELLGRQLDTCASELETALRLRTLAR